MAESNNGLYEEPPQLVRRTPDVLDCLANLSSDEVFTPPALVNRMLDSLPPELWGDPEAKFLDPFCKSGVFLREIAKRLFDGLAPKIPNPAKRREHILQKQVFGVAITEMTAMLARRSLYYSKDASGPFSVVRFATPAGNILFNRCTHHWKDGQCADCGAAKKKWDRAADVENYAYPFIHSKELFVNLDELRFDVVIGNPPYQMSDGSGKGAGALPIYQKFVEQGMKLKPRYLSMIIPARWYGGGRGLDAFRNQMISDKSIRELHDFQNAADCFGNGIELKGGICYFLWDSAHKGKCHIYTHDKESITSQGERFMKESDACDVFIKYQKAVDIFHKVVCKGKDTFDSIVSPQRPFGLRTFIHGKKSAFTGSIKLIENGGVGYVAKKDIERNQGWIAKPKVYISAAYNAGDTYPHQILGKPIIGEADSCCTETYLCIGPFEAVDEAHNVASYIRTRFFRVLVMMKKSSQHAPASVYSFVPMQDFSKPWTDEELYAKYRLTKKEIAFIESMIRPME